MSTNNSINNYYPGTMPYLSTTPMDSSSASTTFPTSMTAGTAVKNTLGCDTLVNICVIITLATAATITMGVGPISMPATSRVIPSVTLGALTLVTFSAIVPNNYYLVVKTTGIINISSISTQACPI